MFNAALEIKGSTKVVTTDPTIRFIKKKLVILVLKGCNAIFVILCFFVGFMKTFHLAVENAVTPKRFLNILIIIKGRKYRDQWILDFQMTKLQTND